LAPAPWTVEKDVAFVIHVVPSGDQAINMERPLEVFYLGDFDGAYLQGIGENGLMWEATRRAVREYH
jgi:hypothetical protein